MAEGKDNSLSPIVMDYFEQSPSKMSQNSAQPFSLQDLPPALQGSLNTLIQEYLKIQRTSEELSKEVEDLKRQVLIEKTEKEAVQKKYDELLLKDAAMQASGGPSSSSIPQTRMAPPESLQLKSGMDSDLTHLAFEEEGSLQADGGIPKGWNASLMSDDNDGLVRRGGEFMQQEVKSAMEVTEQVNKSAPEDDDFIANDDEVPKAKVTTNHLEFMATGLDMYNWQTYMRALGLHDSDLEDIRYNYRDNAYEQRYQALLFWRNKNGLEASPESLITAALRRNQRLLAEKFCKNFKGFEHLLRKDPDKKKTKKGDISPHGDSTKSYTSENDIATGMKRVTIADSDRCSVSSFSEEQSYFSAPGDRAVPTTPPHSGFRKSPSTPAMTGTVASPSYSQQSQSGSTLSTLFVLLKGYMNNPDDGNRLLYEISQMPFVVDVLNAFIRNLLNHHDEEMFKKMINEKLPPCTNWWHVCECWAECVISTDIVSWKQRPPIFLWNFCYALHSCGFSRLYEKMKKFLKPGSVGPCLHHTESLSEAKWSLLHDVSVRLLQQVSGAPDWRKIAEELGCNKEIPIWEQNGNGGKNVIQVYKTRGKTVGDLYEMLYRMKRNDIVICMEDLKYTLPLSEHN